MPALCHLHMDPEHPVPGTGDGMLLETLPAEAIDELVRVAGAAASSPTLSIEVRHLGGELRRGRPEHGAFATVDAEYALYAVGIAPTAEAVAAVRASIESVREALRPWEAEQMYLNFADTRRDPRTLWAEGAYDRLCAIKEAVDPDNLIRSNHPLP
jgi:berberine-like enzyme